MLSLYSLHASDREKFAVAPVVAAASARVLRTRKGYSGAPSSSAASIITEVKMVKFLKDVTEADLKAALTPTAVVARGLKAVSYSLIFYILVQYNIIIYFIICKPHLFIICPRLDLFIIVHAGQENLRGCVD